MVALILCQSQSLLSNCPYPFTMEVKHRHESHWESVLLLIKGTLVKSANPHFEVWEVTRRYRNKKYAMEPSPMKVLLNWMICLIIRNTIMLLLKQKKARSTTVIGLISTKPREEKSWFWEAQWTVSSHRWNVWKNRIEKKDDKKKSDKEQVIIFNENIPQLRFDFIKSQSLCNKRGLRGMRWTDADYNLATSIHFQSPATYRFLWTIFGLPGTSMLYSRLRGCFPRSGICMNNLENLQHKLASCFELEQYCVLSFDGMKTQ